MHAIASHHIQGGNEKYGDRVGEYMYCIQGVGPAVYRHPCMLYRETGLIQYVDR